MCRVGWRVLVLGAFRKIEPALLEQLQKGWRVANINVGVRAEEIRGLAKPSGGSRRRTLLLLYICRRSAALELFETLGRCVAAFCHLDAVLLT